MHYMYRANHVYLLLGSLLVAAEAGWRRQLSQVGSLFVLFAPVVLGYAFVYQAPLATPERMYTLVGNALLLAAVAFHFLARRPLRLLLGVRNPVVGTEHTR
jgi:hypothetical protein